MSFNCLNLILGLQYLMAGRSVMFLIRWESYILNLKPIGIDIPHCSSVQ